MDNAVVVFWNHIMNNKLGLHTYGYMVVFLNLMIDRLITIQYTLTGLLYLK